MYDFLNMLLRILDIVHLLSLLHQNNVWVSNCIVTIYREPTDYGSDSRKCLCNFWRLCCGSD